MEKVILRQTVGPEGKRKGGEGAFFRASLSKEGHGKREKKTRLRSGERMSARRLAKGDTFPPLQARKSFLHLDVMLGWA